MLATLAQCDLTIDKSAQIYRMNQLEQSNYQTLNKQIGKIKCLNYNTVLDDKFDIFLKFSGY